MAARAAEAQGRSWLTTVLAAPAFRWTMSGAAVAGALALIVVARGPVQQAKPGGEVLAQEVPAGAELALAQRLDLYEDLTVVQDQDALEDLDVVSVLHELQTEGKP